jgi:hydroxymethylpyrimidine/phosphomethylpyrimidine kinase
VSTLKKALSIAGSDSGGGAGIQADLKTFQELEVFGMSALTAVTAQNTLGIQAVFPMTAEAVSTQIESIGEDMGTDAIKTGMLFNAEIIQAVCTSTMRFDLTKYHGNWIDFCFSRKYGGRIIGRTAVYENQKNLYGLYW